MYDEHKAGATLPKSPKGLRPPVRQYLEQRPGVTEVCDLHIWPMSTTDTALTAHLVMDRFPSDDHFLDRVSRVLQERFSINHPTIQLEHSDSEVVCRQSLHCAD